MATNEEKEDKYEPTDPEEELIDKNKEEEDTIRIILIGRTGSGKSATINTIMNQYMAKTQSSATSVTHSCQRYEMDANRTNIILVDTPGFFDTQLSIDEIKAEIVKCFALMSPGPHIILYVIKVSRQTKEEIQAVKAFLHLFGGYPLRYTIVVFTGRDDLEWNGTSIQEFMKNIPPYFKQFLDDCSQRFVFLNNRLFEKETSRSQVNVLFDIVNRVMQENVESPYYTNIITNALAKHGIERRGEVLRSRTAKRKIALGFFGTSLIGVYFCFSPIFLVLAVISGFFLWWKRHEETSSKASEVSDVMDDLNRNFSSMCSIS